jgi:peptidoglycan hydrolase CwlO-like protein
MKKFLSILLVILVCAGAGFGGYFAYQNELPWQQKTPAADLSVTRATTVNSYMVEIMGLQNNSNEMQARILEMRNQIEFLISMPDGDNATLDYLYDTIINSQGQIATNSAKIVTLQGQVLDVLAEQDNLIHNTVDHYKANFGALLTEIEQMRVTIQTFTSDNENVIEAIAEFSDKINSFGAVIQQMQSEISALVARIDTADYVVASAYNLTGTGYTNGWYRKYKSGWVEQGAFSNKKNNGNGVIGCPFFVTMANTNYSVSALPQSQNDGSNNVFAIRETERANTHVQFVTSIANVNQIGTVNGDILFHWEVRGMAA